MGELKIFQRGVSVDGHHETEACGKMFRVALARIEAVLVDELEGKTRGAALLDSVGVAVIGILRRYSQGLSPLLIPQGNFLKAFERNEEIQSPMQGLGGVGRCQWHGTQLDLLERCRGAGTLRWK